MSVLEIVLSVLLVVVVAYGAYLRRKLTQVPTSPVELGDRKCGVCGRLLPKNAVRTHEGKWRCVEHKQVK